MADDGNTTNSTSEARGWRAWKTWQKWTLGVLGSLIVLIVIGSILGEPETADRQQAATVTPAPTQSAPLAQQPDSVDQTATPATPEPTVRPAAQPARSQPAPFELTGSGQQATNAFQLAGGVTVFKMTHQGASNFAIWLKDGSSGENVELLVNTIGSFNGSKLVGVPSGSYLLDVSADGSWRVTVEQPRPSGAEGAPQTFTGSSQSAAGPIELKSGLARFALKHSGDGNFALWLIDDSGDNVALLANDIGPFDGSKAEQVLDGIYWFDVTANGNWSIEVTQ